MNRIAKFLACAAAVAMAVPTAASAQYRYRDRDRGVDWGDVITGVAVIGGVAAIASALSRDRGRYGGYGDYGYRTRNYYVSAVNACARYADRYGGRVRILDVDRRSSNRYRVRGVIESGFGGGYGGYDRDDRYGGYGGYDRYGYGGRGYYGNRSFACTATDYGRITDFDLNGRNRW